jgi:UDP-N-acetylglucosamine 2-epimerase (non-hydrolysing)
MTVVGTRPEIIRLSQVLRRLDEVVDLVLVHTGQNWDRQLSGIFFEELGLRAPDIRLDVDTSSLGAVLGGVLAGIEPVIRVERPDAFLVLGDTNSCLAAVMAKRMHVPVFHMEAGNRCFDESVPEETNRRIIDHLADFNLCYTEHARRNLLAEGLHPRRTFVTGSPMKEVLSAYEAQIAASDVLRRLDLESGRYLLVSMHREENIDYPENLFRLLESLRGVQDAFGYRLLISTHPRLRKRLEALQVTGATAFFELHEPFGYFDYNHLQQHALCVLSDSGTISEESALLGFPAVTIRNAMERPEALDTGSMILTGLDAVAVERAVLLVIADHESGHRPSVPADYQIADSSHRVTRLITGLAGVHHVWASTQRPGGGAAAPA